MEKFLVLCIALLVTANVTAQVQHGIVKTIGRPGKPGRALGGVTVRVREVHNAVVSSSNGQFSVSMPGKQAGEAFVLQDFHKQGFEPACHSDVGRKFAFSGKVPLTLTMVDLKELETDKQRIEGQCIPGS